MGGRRFRRLPFELPRRRGRRAVPRQSGGSLPAPSERQRVRIDRFLAPELMGDEGTGLAKPRPYRADGQTRRLRVLSRAREIHMTPDERRSDVRRQARQDLEGAPVELGTLGRLLRIQRLEIDPVRDVYEPLASHARAAQVGACLSERDCIKPTIEFGARRVVPISRLPRTIDDCGCDLGRITLGNTALSNP
jgi:hypothetical protein